MVSVPVLLAVSVSRICEKHRNENEMQNGVIMLLITRVDDVCLSHIAGCRHSSTRSGYNIIHACNTSRSTTSLFEA